MVANDSFWQRWFMTIDVYSLLSSYAAGESLLDSFVGKSSSKSLISIGMFGDPRAINKNLPMATLSFQPTRPGTRVTRVSRVTNGTASEFFVTLQFWIHEQEHPVPIQRSKHIPITLWYFNIANENCDSFWVFPLKITMFNSYELVYWRVSMFTILMGTTFLWGRCKSCGLETDDELLN